MNASTLEQITATEAGSPDDRLALQLAALGLSARTPPTVEAWPRLLSAVRDAYASDAARFAQMKYAIESRSRPRASPKDDLLNVSTMRLAAREVELAAVIDAVGEGLCVIDREGRARVVNRALEEMLGAPPRTLTGQPFLDERAIDVHGQRSDRISIARRSVLDGAGSVSVADVWLLCADGARVPVELMIAPVGGAEGPTSVVAIVRDVSARKLADDRLVSAKEAAEAADRAKDNFCAIVSHELRTPVAAILGMLELLQDGALDAAQREAAAAIGRSSAAMLGIVNELLDYAKIRSGELRIQSIDFDPVAVVEDAVGALQGVAICKGLALRTRLDPDLPRWLRGDPQRLRQVLTNLVGNAIKFTDEGSVEVHVRADLRLGLGDKHPLRFTVVDTGVGIPADALPRLFTPFQQLDPARSKDGTGLGLALARQLVERMGGALGYRANTGGGSVFAFDLPLTAAHEAPPDEDEAPVRSRELIETLAAPAMPSATSNAPMNAPTIAPTIAPIEKPWVLVAEDDDVNRRVAILMLERLGYRVIAVGDGEAALAEMASGRHEFLAVLMDCQMPKLDGFEVVRTVRKVLGDECTPIIATTANVMEGARERCLAEGMTDFVSKPISFATLKRVLARAVTTRHRRQSIAAAASISAPRFDGSEAPPVLDRSLYEALGPRADAALIQELSDVYRHDVRRRLDALRGAADAGRVDEARRLAHAIKGASASFGAQRAALRAQAIESMDTTPAGTTPSMLRGLVDKLAVEIVRVDELLSKRDEASVARSGSVDARGGNALAE